jgi:osmotically-inducible protein OsmY
MVLALTAFAVGCKPSEERFASQQFDKNNQERSAAAREAKERASDKNEQADNSRMNAMDRESSKPTADQAKNNLSDINAMQMIRQSIVADKALSIYAHNVKVISQNGHVTLNGTVHTQEEKSTIAAKASEVVGKENVTNQIEIKGI